VAELLLPRGALATDDDGALLCHVCGLAYQRLAQHARLAHGLGAHEYRVLAGLNRQTVLFSTRERARLREQTAPLIARLRAEGALRTWAEDPERWARAKREAVAVLREEGLRPEGRARRRQAVTPERRAAMASRARQRNLAGELRASPEAIRAGLRHTLVCADCGVSFETAGTRTVRCRPCRQAAQRAYDRAWKRARRPQQGPPVRTPQQREAQRAYARAYRRRRRERAQDLEPRWT